MTDIMVVLSKLQKGEELNEEEKAFASTFDPNKVINDAVAAQKRKAEAKLTEFAEGLEKAQKTIADLEEAAKEKVNSGKTKAEKLESVVEGLAKQLKDAEEARIASETKRTAMEKSAKVRGLLAKNEISFHPNVDHELMTQAFESQFAEVDLENDDLVAPLVKAFVEKNKAAIVDKSGFGSGNGPHTGGTPSSKSETDWSKKDFKGMSPEEAQKDLNKMWAEPAQER